MASIEAAPGTPQRRTRRPRTPGVSLATATFLLGFIFAAAVVPNVNRDPVATTALGGSSPLGVSVGSGGGQALGADSSAVGSSIGGSGTPSVTAGGGATGGGATGGGATGGGATGGGATAANSCSSGGATAQGVTKTEITVGLLNSSTETLRPVYGNRAAQGGQQTDKYLVKGVTDRWRREGRLPVCGRDLKVTYAEVRSLDDQSQQAACEELAAAKPFVALGPAPTGAPTALCMSGQFKLPTIIAQGALGDDELQQMYPLAWDAGPSLSRSMRNWVPWLKANGYLEGQVLGLYAPAASPTGGTMDPFRQELKAQGYKLAVDYEMASNQGGDSSLAVSQFRQAGVTVALIFSNLSEPHGFQNNAAAQGYHPKYPQADFGNFAMNDTITELSYNVDEQHGNKGMAVRFYDWDQRSPAVPRNNPAAAQCLADYTAASGFAPSVYDDDALIQYILDECTILEVLIDALHNAGPNLTIKSLVTGISQIRDKQTAEYPRVNFGPNKLSGSDVYQTAEFNKARWEPEHQYWRNVATWQPFWL